ncbi:Histidine kinase [Rhodovastum atsumiense]|uniref:histidine kinase n=1 Tax=Rhodovastum atsumiense TaxID=504468 RepID=A0A5M6IJP9_9PROT|nr:ATP-binding protein [Rhodovastum atsumiense]KAA5608494.1 PAS domain-containing protein [Rhodovastum atsumiense]CAH2599290.1 Histidine kinase [Rhodovastum atsumiense]
MRVIDEAVPFRRVLAAALLALTVMAGATAEYLGARAIAARAAETMALANAAVVAPAREVQRLLDTVRWVQDLLRLRADLRAAGDVAAAVRLEEELRRANQSNLMGIARIAVATEAGHIAWASFPEVCEEMGGASYFQALRHGGSGQVIAGPVPGPCSGQLVIIFARSLRHADGSFAGVAMVSIPALTLSGLLGQPEGKVAVNLYRLSDGRLLARSKEPEEVLQRGLLMAPAHLESARRDPAALPRGPNSIDGRDTFFARRVVAEGGLLVSANLDAESELQPACLLRWLFRAIAGFVVLTYMAGAGVLLVMVSRARVASAQRELERLIAGLPAVVYHGAIAGDGTYTRLYLSRNTMLAIGCTPAEVAAPSDWFARIHPGDHDTARALRRRLLETGNATADYRFARSDGRHAWLRDSARLVVQNPDGSGEIIGTVIDVTEERDLAAQAVMAGKLASLGELATVIGHELNQPLTAMRLLADGIGISLKTGAIERTGPMLTELVGQVARAAEIAGELRRFGRKDGDEVMPVPLSEVVRGVMVLAEAPLRAAQVAVEIDVPADLPRALGRRTPIEQVLLNLVVNACHALEEMPSDRRRLSIQASATATDIVLEVSDTGPGIPPDLLARVFDPFFTTKQEGSGTGLGLSICRTILGGLGGRIEASSDPGGSCFIVTLRRAPEGGSAYNQWAGTQRHPPLSLAQ